MLAFAHNKTEVILFSRTHKIPDDSELHFTGQMIKPKHEVEYLGLLLNRKLNWHSKNYKSQENHPRY